MRPLALTGASGQASSLRPGLLSLMERLLRADIPVPLSGSVGLGGMGGGRGDWGAGDVVRVSLTWQYRCHPAISAAASALFYGAMEGSGAVGAEGGHLVDMVSEKERDGVWRLAPISVFDTCCSGDADIASSAEMASSGKNFGKVLYVVALNSKYNRALTFQNLWQAQPGRRVLSWKLRGCRRW
jgi:hypothetical protein